VSYLQSYKIPTEVSTELKINKFIYLTDLFLLFGLFTLRMLTINYIHSDFRWPFTIFLVIVGIILIIRPFSNPQKRMLEALLYALVRKRDAFCAIDYNKEKE
jgi:uncharacterized membrane protein